MDRKAFWAVVGSNVLFGCSFMATTVAIETSDSALFGLLAARFLFAFLAMGALALAGVVKVDYRGKPLAKLLGISLLYPGLYFFSEAMSLTQVSSAIVGVVIGIAPITTALLSILLYHTRHTPRQLLFMVLSIAGVVVINSGDVTGEGLSLLAVVFLALALVSFSAYSIGIHSAGRQFTAGEITLFMLFAGAVQFNLLDAAARGPFAYVADFADLRFLGAVLFLGVAVSGASSLALNYGLCKLPPVTVSVLNNVTSLVAVLCGLLFLREPLDLLSLTGCALILAGCTGYSLFSKDTGRADP